jgi:hypothetical protein
MKQDTHTPKEYYSLTDLRNLNLTPLKQKQLSIRFSKLVSSGKLIYGENLHRIGSSWQIHYTAIPLFDYHSLMQLHIRTPPPIIDIYP